MFCDRSTKCYVYNVINKAEEPKREEILKENESMSCKERNQKICQKLSVNFDRRLWSAHNDLGDVSYINGKLQESTFHNFLRIVNTYFGEEFMTVWVAEGQSARISDLDQNFYFEAQTTLVSPWTSFEGFITLITAEKRKKTKKSTEEKKRKRRKEREKRERRKEEPRRIRPVSRPIKFFFFTLISSSMDSLMFSFKTMCN